MDDLKEMVLEMPIRVNECGPDRKLRGYIWFDYLQHIAALHAERMGFGMTAILKSNFIWVLARLKLRIDEYPDYDDAIRIATYPNGTEKLLAKRQFVMDSVKHGRRLGCASSAWLVLDAATLRPKPPCESLGADLNVNLDREDFFPNLAKLPAVETPECPVTHNVSASHIDMNDHLNNTYYGEYTLDWIARRTGSLVRFREIQINYNHAMKFGGDLVVSGRLDGSAFAVEGTDAAGGRNSFQAAGIFEKL